MKMIEWQAKSDERVGAAVAEPLTVTGVRNRKTAVDPQVWRNAQLMNNFFYQNIEK